MKQKILLLDVSHLFFRAFFAIPRTLTNADGQAINAIFGVSSMILSLIESETPQYIFGAKDEKGKTLRHDRIENYKGHRPEMPPELVTQLPHIFDIFAAFDIPVFSQAGYEADDFLATLAEQYRDKEGFEIEIVTGDHDAFQLVADNVVVGLPQNGGKKPLRLDRQGVFEKTGVYPEQIADFKGLAGDSSDNLKGIEGIGKKTAAKLLQEHQNLENILRNTEHISGKLGEKLEKGKEIALLTKEIATLHRDITIPDFDLEQGNIKNISPPKVDQFLRKYNFHSLLNRLPNVLNGINLPAHHEHEELWAELDQAQEPEKLTPENTKTKDQMSLF